MEDPARYDIVISGGTVVDPSQGLNGRRDVGIRDGRIAAVEERIHAAAAARVVDATGKIVTPGLIDLHAHVYWKFVRLSLEPDEICGRTGVTTVVDTGTAGAVTFAGFRHFIIERARTRIVPFLHVTSIGLVTDKECRDLDHIDVDYPPPSIDQIFPLMRPGDISTHMYKGYHGGLLMDWNTRVRPCALEARERGITFDLGHGGGSFSWEVAVPACQQGFFPDTISTDLHQGSVQLPDCDVPNCMSKLIALGASLEDVVRWTTVNAARALRRDDIGTLRVGSSGDVTVLELAEGEQTFYDVARKPYPGRQRLKALFTVCRGVVTYEG